MRIIEDDAETGLLDLANNSIDFVATDPPYGYNFMGKDWDKVLPDPSIWRECRRILKPGAFMCVMSAPRMDVMSRMINRIEDAGFDMTFTPIFWAYPSGFPKAANVSKLIDKKLGHEQEIIGPKPYTASAHHSVPTADHTQRRQLDDTISVSDEGRHFNGAYVGFQPKPAVEVVLVCMKPLEDDSYTDQALANGKGVSWIDDCRIPFRDKDDLGDPDRFKGANIKSINFEYMNNKDDAIVGQLGGRFPANLLSSDQALDDGKIRKSPSRYHTNSQGYVFGPKAFPPHTSYQPEGDEGSFNRYFDLDAWQAQFLIVEKPSQTERNIGLRPAKDSLAAFCRAEDAKGIFPYQANDGRAILPDNPFQRGQTVRLNSHPTVKPISLMSWLITMFSREGDTILDPFMGSGTTNIAAQLLKRKSIGIERDHHHCIIAALRMEYWKNKTYEKVRQIIREQERENQSTIEAYL